jgi:hypothetical protein
VRDEFLRALVDVVFDRRSEIVSLLDGTRCRNRGDHCVQVCGWHFLAGAGRSHGAATLVSEDDDHLAAKVLDCVFEATNGDWIRTVAGVAYDEDVAYTLVEAA